MVPLTDNNLADWSPASYNWDRLDRSPKGLTIKLSGWKAHFDKSCPGEAICLKPQAGAVMPASASSPEGVEPRNDDSHAPFSLVSMPVLSSDKKWHPDNS